MMTEIEKFKKSREELIARREIVLKELAEINDLLKIKKGPSAKGLAKGLTKQVMTFLERNPHCSRAAISKGIDPEQTRYQQISATLASLASRRKIVKTGRKGYFRYSLAEKEPQQ